MLKALIADDDTEIRMHIVYALALFNKGVQTYEAATARDALRLCAINNFDLIFLDHHLMDGDGWEIARTISLNTEKYGKPEIIAMTGSISPYELAKQQGRFSRLILKPLSVSDIDAILRRHINLSQMQMNDQLHNQI